MLVPVTLNCCASVCRFAAVRSQGLTASEDATPEFAVVMFTFALAVPVEWPLAQPRIGAPDVHAVEVLVTVRTAALVGDQFATSVRLIVSNGR